MSDFHVLVSTPLIHDSINEFDDLLEAHGITYDIPEIDQHLDEEDLLPIIDQYDGVIAGDDEFTREVLEEAGKLNVVSKWGVGTDSIDKEAAADLGITVYNTPGAFTDEVADVVFGYAVMLTRQLHHIDRAVREGEWICPRGTSLADKTFGVIGVGDIGSTVARRAAGFDMDVLGHDVEPIPKELKREVNIEPVGCKELLSRADVVSLNCNLNEATRGMIGAEELDLIGDDGYLINAARGELVDQDALVTALENGCIAGAALDVFEEEPLPADSPLTEIDDAILGTHNAQNTHEAIAAVNDRAVNNLIEGLES